MEIRNARKEDCKNVYNLIIELKPNIDYNKFLNAYYANLESDSILYNLLFENGIPIGFISLYIEYQLHHAEKVATVEELVVKKKHRGKGYGKILLEYGIQLAKNNECDVIELTSNFTRETAHIFYENNGLKKTGYKFKMKL